MSENLMLACCGLNCGDCEIRLAPSDPAAAEVVEKWFRSRGWLKADEGLPQIIERKMYCTGCQGDRSTHWSADCWILSCCIDQHSLANCSECELFPCERLQAWASQNEAYQAAFERLKELNRQAKMV